jgi:tRNA(Ile)-lysidine synthase
MTSLQAAVRRSLREFGVPAPGQTVVAALSGGPDSVALLHALHSAAPRMGFRVVAAHLDHGLRPASGADAAFCRNLAEGLGVSVHMGSADVRGRARRERAGLEDAARAERYSFLRQVAWKEGASAIALGHTRDDQAETLLLRLLRGAGSAGLGAMRPKRGDLIRPLLRISRADVLAHLAAHGLDWREDPSNADLSLRRNRVRHELLPYLEARVNPSARRTLARTAAILADEAAWFAGEAARLLPSLSRPVAGGITLDRPALRGVPTALARHVLRRALRDAGGLRGVSALHIERLLQLAVSEGGARRRLPLPGAREALVGGGQLTIGVAPAAAPRRVRAGENA